MRTQDALVVRSTNNDVDWVDTVERTAAVMKKFFTKTTCRLCQVYVDQQVQYEVQQEDKQLGTHWVSSVRDLEVELYRQFLFDENSVIEHVDSFRDETEDTPTKDMVEEAGCRTEASSSCQENDNTTGINNLEIES